MAKNYYLFGIFLCLVAGLCIGIGGIVVGVGYWALGDRVSGIESCEQSASSFQLSAISIQPESEIATSAVILSGTEWSRKISLLEAEPVRHAISPLSATSQLISPFCYAPVDKTAVNGAFDASFSEADLIRNKIKQIYTAEIGVREKTGKNDGVRVEEYLAVTQLGRGYAWCAAFVSWVFAEAGFPEPRTPWSPALFPKKRVIWERGKAVRKPTPSVILSGTKWSRKISPLAAHIVRPANTPFSSGHQQIFPLRLASAENTDVGLTPNTQYLKTKPGDVFGIYYTNLKRIAHVGFVDEWGEKQIITVEGNTNEAGSGEGDGVYRKRRPIASIYQVANWIDQEVEQ